MEKEYKINLDACEKLLIAVTQAKSHEIITTFENIKEDPMRMLAAMLETMDKLEEKIDPMDKKTIFSLAYQCGLISGIALAASSGEEVNSITENIKRLAAREK